MLDRRTTVLVLIGMQREYVTPGRPFSLDGADPAIENVRKLLDHARQARWPVAHVRHCEQGILFNAELEGSRFIPGLEPLGHEMVFVKSGLSAYGNQDFAATLNAQRSERIVVAGLAGNRDILATIVDGFNRGNRLAYIADASWSTSATPEKSATIHGLLTEITSTFADIVSTESLLASR